MPPTVSQIPEQLCAVLIRQCDSVDRQWGNVESSAAEVYFALAPRFMKHRPRIVNEEGWMRRAARREAVAFHTKHQKRKTQVKTVSLNEDNLSLGATQGISDPLEQKVHCCEHERFGIEEEIDGDIHRQALGSFESLDSNSRLLVGAALRLPEFPRFSDIARRLDKSRQNIQQKAIRRLEKWKETLQWRAN